MGTCRQSQNIFADIKNKNYKGAWYWIRHFDRLTYEDSFMPIVCKVRGHKAYQPEPEYEPNEWACKRCHKYINYNPRKEKLKKLNKLKG